MAKFNYAVCYQVKATCLSPLRTGGSDGTLLLDGDGQYFIQGSSIAGVLRSYLTREQGEDAASHLFGDARGSGTDSLLTVSDGTFSTAPEAQHRPRLRIDRRTGTGEDGKFFETDGLPVGAELSFQLLLKLQVPMEQLQSKEVAQEQETVEQLLQAMHTGVITLGGQRSNGFGAVELEVSRQCYDLTDEADRMAWIRDEAPVRTERLMLKDGKERGISFVLTGHMPSVFVRSGHTEAEKKKQEEESEEEAKKRKSIALPMKELGQCLLPASSIKGCVRSQAERIAAYLGREELISSLFGQEAERGFTGTAAKLRVHECQIEAVKEKIDITRTRINRFTGGVMEKKLFSLRPVSGKVTIQVDLVRPTTEQERAILFYALRDLAAGLYGIGSGGTVGYGYLMDAALTVHDGEKNCTFHYDEHQNQTVDGAAEVVESWLNALEKGGAPA